MKHKKVWIFICIGIFVISISVVGIKQKENNKMGNTLTTSSISLSNKKIGIMKKSMYI